MGRHVASAGFGGLRQQLVVLAAVFALTAASLLYVIFDDAGGEGVQAADARPSAEQNDDAPTDGTDGADTSEPSETPARPSPADTGSRSTRGGTAGSSVPTEEDPTSTADSESDGHAGTSDPPSPPSDVPDPDRTSAPPSSDPPSSDPPSPLPPTRTSAPEPTTEPPTPTGSPTAPSGDPAPTPPTSPPASPEPTKKPKPTHPVDVKSYWQGPGRFLTIVTVENNSSGSLTWDLALAYEEVDVTYFWDAEISLEGDLVTAHGEGSLAVLEPGEEARFGFIARGTPDEPLSCSIVGAYCEIETD